MLAFHLSSHFMNRGDFPILRWKRVGGYLIRGSGVKGGISMGYTAEL